MANCRAHIELWSFLDEIKEEIHPLSTQNHDPIIRLFQTCCHYLHPSYKYDYISKVFPLVLEALSLDKKEILDLLSEPGFSNLLADAYTEYVASRIPINPQ